MHQHHYFFAGGGTGGHIYPGIAVAEQIVKHEPGATVHFFCSDREIDGQILSQTSFEYTALPAKAFSARPIKLAGFFGSMYKSYRIAGKIIAGKCPTTVVLLGLGGFASASAVLAATKLGVPIALLSTDAVPGRANKILARFARQIFVQFEETRSYFAKVKAEIIVTGCPLRNGFANVDRSKAVSSFGLDENKKTLLVMGGSSGAKNINNVVCLLLEGLKRFSDDWQVVHLAGRANFESVRYSYERAGGAGKVLAYCNDMPALLSAADLVVGRSGAVSVAEYAAAGVPSVCLPYPYHADRQQYLNADKLVEAGCGVVVNDTGDSKVTAPRLWARLEELMKNESKRKTMAEACRKIAKLSAAEEIAQKLKQMSLTI